MPQCKDCGQEKTVEAFYHDPTRGTQRHARCTECSNRAREQRRKRARVREFLAEGEAWKRAHPERFQHG